MLEQQKHDNILKEEILFVLTNLQDRCSTLSIIVSTAAVYLGSYLGKYQVHICGYT